MGFGRSRVWLLVFVILAAFAVSAAILLKVMPGPRRDADYLVIGGAATLVALLAAFVVSLRTWVRSGGEVFYKRRKPE